MAWTLRLPKHLENGLESLSLSQGASKQRIVEKAVEEYLEGRERTPSKPVLAPVVTVAPEDVTLGPGNVTPALEKLGEEPFMPCTMGFLEQESPEVEPKPAAREKKCIHLIEAGDFCPFCDESVT